MTIKSLSNDLRSDDNYEGFSKLMSDKFSIVGNPLFIVDADNLFDVYLSNIPEEGRQHYNCNCCRHFINHYGSLVTIDSKHNVKSALWDETNVPEFFKESVKSMREAVESSKVKKMFISSQNKLGISVAGGWEHLSLILPNSMVYHSMVKTDGQQMAEKIEDYLMLSGAISQYDKNVASKAFELLNSGTMYRSDSVFGVAKWFNGLYEKLDGVKNDGKLHNIIWLAVATAPTGYTHIKSSMIGTLLDDLKEGLSTESVSARFAEKMNPSNYQRSTVAPTQGNVYQAEKIVEKLGIANSLKRRYAKFEEIPRFLWKSFSGNVKVAPTSGVFSGIVTKTKEVVNDNFNLPTTTMTWQKFQKTVLDNAQSIEVKADNPNKFMALITASDETAPNILQWDNTFSWYYHGGIDSEIKRRVEDAGGRYENNEIRCSLIWEGPTDLDLHCVTPLQDHIYFGHKIDVTGSGGVWLDVDANGGHVTSYTPVENIRCVTAREGNYRFYVHNFLERGYNGNGTPFKVELEVNGKVYSYSNLAQYTGWQKDAFSFTYKKGIEPVISGNSYQSSSSWGIAANAFAKVNGITVSPNLWNNDNEHSGNHVFFILDKCKDSSEGKGRGFFNEMLKSELREVRKTLEAYTANALIEDVEESDACGVGYSKDGEWNLTLKVTTKSGSVQIVKIDRWD